MNIFEGAGNVLKNIGNFLLPGEPFKTTISPISTVSTKPKEIGTTNTKTTTTYLPSTQYPIDTNKGKITYVTDPLKVNPSNILVAPSDYYLTGSAQSSGFWGNIWDTVKGKVEDVINLGTNILTQKVEGATNSPEISYNPNTSMKVTNPFANYSDPQKLVQGILGTATKKTTQGGVGQGISGGVSAVNSKLPVWLWLALGGLAIVFIVKRR